MLIRKIKYRFKMIFKSKYDKSFYCNYLNFYNMLYHNRIKNLKQMKKNLIKMVEKSYNKTINEDKPTMFIYNKERQCVDRYWNEYFMRNVLQLKDIYDEPKKLCRQYRKANRKYKEWDEIINKFNKSTESYLEPSDNKNEYLMYIIRILDVKIDIYYNTAEKRKLYTKKYKINENVYDKLEKQIRSNKDVR